MAFLAEQIFQWRPEVRPLTGWEWAVVGLFLLGDIPLLGPYARKALARPQQKHYGAMNLIAHFLAGAGMVVLGPLGLALQVSTGRFGC